MSLQAALDTITQNTRKLVQPERLAHSERLVHELFDSGIEETVLPAGSPVPFFDLPDAVTGKRVRSTDLLALGPLVINFFRGRWDPYCVTELEMWRDLYPELRKHGVLLVGISPQTLRQSEFAAQQHGIPFPLLHDAGCEVAKQFGIVYPVTPEMDRYYRSILVNLPFINGGTNVMSVAGAEVSRLPLPATFVVGQSGQVLFSEGHADFRVRPEPEDALRVLKEKADSFSAC